MSRALTREDGLAAVYGGAILGGGGGGHLADGLARVDAVFGGAYDAPVLASVDDLADDALVACVALVGAPSDPRIHITDEHVISCVRRLSDAIGGGLAAVMTNENGPATTVNGWLQAAAVGLPVLDAPANGRAHPTGLMGSLQLHQEPDYVSHQAFAGGKGSEELSGVLSGPLDGVSQAVRTLSIQAGGMVGVCRNPVPVSRAREKGAVGAISRAIEVGRAYLSGSSGEERIANVVENLGARVIATGAVEQVELRKDGGFDVGRVVVSGQSRVELSFWNEYMTAVMDGGRLATFPDLLMTLDSETGGPIVSAAIQQGQEVTVIAVPKARLLLGEIEPVLGLDILAHQ
jgi:DUF917 family protein